MACQKLVLLRKGKLERVLGMGVAILNRTVKGKLTNEVTFEQKPKEGEEVSQWDIWGKVFGQREEQQL